MKHCLFVLFLGICSLPCSSASFVDTFNIISNFSGFLLALPAGLLSEGYAYGTALSILYFSIAQEICLWKYLFEENKTPKALGWLFEGLGKVMFDFNSNNSDSDPTDRFPGYSGKTFWETSQTLTFMVFLGWFLGIMGYFMILKCSVKKPVVRYLVARLYLAIPLKFMMILYCGYSLAVNITLVQMESLSSLKESNFLTASLGWLLYTFGFPFLATVFVAVYHKRFSRPEAISIWGVLYSDTVAPFEGAKFLQVYWTCGLLLRRAILLTLVVWFGGSNPAGVMIFYMMMASVTFLWCFKCGPYNDKKLNMLGWGIQGSMVLVSSMLVVVIQTEDEVTREFLAFFVYVMGMLVKNAISLFFIIRLFLTIFETYLACLLWFGDKRSVNKFKAKQKEKKKEKKKRRKNKTHVANPENGDSKVKPNESGHISMEIQQGSDGEAHQKKKFWQKGPIGGRLGGIFSKKEKPETSV